MSDIIKTATEQPLNTVFVYGTLKRFHSNHALLHGAKFLKEAHVKGILLDLGAFPALLECMDGGQKVHGELFQVKDEEQWQALDRLEGHPHHYKRTAVETSQGWAYTYVYQRYAPTHQSYQMIPLGTWHSQVHSLPFFGFRRTLIGLAKVNAVAHYHDDASGFSGLINLYSGAILSTNGKEDLRPHYSFNYMLNQWELAEKPRAGIYVPPPTKPFHAPVVVERNLRPANASTVVAAAPSYVDDTDPGEEDIGAVVNA